MSLRRRWASALVVAATALALVLPGAVMAGSASALSTPPPRTQTTPPPPDECLALGTCFKLDLHIDLVGGSTGTCPSFTSVGGVCIGSSDGTAGWDEPDFLPPAAFAQFSWVGNPGKAISYSAFSVGDLTLATIVGTLPDPGSADFSVSAAYSRARGLARRWFTPDRPGVPAGELGGPLHLDFEGGVIGADVFLRGYLFSNSSPGTA